MPGTTTRGELSKPTIAEAADITVLNANADKLSLYAVGDYLCTSTTHYASPWVGMRAYETDTGAKILWNGTSWVPEGTIRCTSATRPTTIITGQLIYETDTKLTYQYDGAAWKYRSGFSSVTLTATGVSNSTSGTTEVIFTCPSGTAFTQQCTNLTIGGIYILSVTVGFACTVSDDWNILRVRAGGGTVAITDAEALHAEDLLHVINAGHTRFHQTRFTATATTHTFGLSGQRYGGTGSFFIVNPTLTIRREVE